MVKYVTVMCSCLKGVKINLGKTYYSIRYYDIPNASGHNRLYWLYLNCNSIYERRGWGGDFGYAASVIDRTLLRYLIWRLGKVIEYTRCVQRELECLTVPL